MATFNIDWNQFKPSTRGGMAMPSMTPAPTPRPAINTPSLPKPLPTPNTPTPTTAPSKGKIFSGNILQKVLDIPLSLGYARAGFDKGAWEELDRQRQSGVRDRGVQLRSALKGAWEGLKNRADYGTQTEDVNVGKRLGIQNETGAAAFNFANSMASPSLAVSGISKLLSKVPGVSQIASAAGKIGTKATNIAKTIPALYKPIETFSPYFRRPEVGKIVRGAEETATGRVNKVFEEIKALAKGLSREQQVEVGRIIEGGRSADAKLVAIARQAQKMGRDVGQELIAEGLLPKTTKLGKYLPHIFDVAKKEEVAFKKRSIPNIVGNFFKKRTGKEGYLPEFAPSLFKGLGTEVKELEVSKLFKKLASDFGTKVTTKNAVPEGYVWAKDVVKSPALQKLFKRTAIPTDVADYIKRTYTMPKQDLFDKITNIWKSLKTIYNPAYHARNLFSNQILTDMQTGRGAVRTAIDTVRNLGSSKWKQIAKEAGLTGRKTVTQGFEELQDMGKLGSKQGPLAKIKSGVQGFQQGTEDASKITVFRATLEDMAEKAGISVEEAVKNKDWLRQAVDKAEEAIFSPYRISQGERGLVSKLIPFYSFARQALPFTAKTLAKNPSRITKYTKAQNAIEGMSGEEKVPVEQRTKAYKQQLQLPGKDKDGKTRFFDPTYILPWGNVGSDSGQLPFGLSLNPFLTEAYQQAANKDFYFDKPITESNIPRVQKQEKVGHAAKVVEPTAITNFRGKLLPALQNKPDQYGRERTKSQAILDTVFGLKTTKVDTEAMKQSAAKGKAYELKGLEKEFETILADPNLSDKEKRKRIEELRQINARMK